MDRRGFIAALVGGAGFALDAERLLWTKTKTISIPAPRVISRVYVEVLDTRIKLVYSKALRTIEEKVVLTLQEVDSGEVFEHYLSLRPANHLFDKTSSYRGNF